MNRSSKSPILSQRRTASMSNRPGNRALCASAFCFRVSRKVCMKNETVRLGGWILIVNLDHHRIRPPAKANVQLALTCDGVKRNACNGRTCDVSLYRLVTQLTQKFQNHVAAQREARQVQLLVGVSFVQNGCKQMQVFSPSNMIRFLSSVEVVIIILIN